MSENTFTTSGGVVLRIRPVSQRLVDRVRYNLGSNLPEPPTYEERIELPGQEPVVNHIRMTSRDQARKPEEFEAWDNYVKEAEKAKRDYGEGLLNALLVPAIIPDLELPDNDDWEKIHAYLGIDVPTDPIEKKAYYLSYEVLKTGDDLIGAVSAVMRASGVSEEAIRIAEDSFRGSLQK